MNFYEENIEAYLTGKLNSADKIAMETGISNDPLLKSEVDLQNDIIESLKSHRKMQLKNRLNNITVTSTTGVSSTIKIAASLITIGMIGAGVYYMSVFSGQDKETEKVSVVINDNISSTQLQNNDTKVATNIENKEVSTTDLKTTKTTSNDVTTYSTTISNGNNKEVVNTPQANVPTGIIEDTEADRTTRDLTINVPNGEIGQPNVINISKDDVKIVDKNKKDFSYMYSDNKLYLYGNFNEEPYNLFEINTPKSKQLYLFFDGKYYDLKSNQTKVTRLKEVKDASILIQLNKK